MKTQILVLSELISSKTSFGSFLIFRRYESEVFIATPEMKYQRTAPAVCSDIPYPYVLVRFPDPFVTYHKDQREVNIVHLLAILASMNSCPCLKSFSNVPPSPNKERSLASLSVLRYRSLFSDDKLCNYYKILEHSARLIKSYQSTVSLPISPPVELTHKSFSQVPERPNNGKELELFLLLSQ